MVGPPPHQSSCAVEHIDDVINECDVSGGQQQMQLHLSTAENESSGVSSVKSDETPQFSHQVGITNISKWYKTSS